MTGGFEVRMRDLSQNFVLACFPSQNCRPHILLLAGRGRTGRGGAKEEKVHNEGFMRGDDEGELCQLHHFLFVLIIALTYLLQYLLAGRDEDRGMAIW